ncbi:DUF2986 domain-containing protein [Psychrosphaera aestuarii]|uniref:DUF2986 domain-containing protein n=1 Tax=Psychrosphaera aestuarii TaxID=1266052 RepID=UPI001B31FAB6
MNRKKKINETLKRKAKKMNDKRNPKKKERYISKAERAKLETIKSEDTNQIDTDMGGVFNESNSQAFDKE